MIYLLRHFILCLGCLFSASLLAWSVPFENITLNPNQTLVANYAFGTHKTIFCYVSSPASINALFWTYQGKNYSSVIPVSLTNDPLYTGSFADPSGNLVIQNQSGGALQFSCLFGF